MDETPDSDGTSKPSPDSDRDESEQTALVPKSLLAGKDFKPGDEVVFKVVHIYEDEIEVKYAKEPENKEGEGENTMASAETELRGMDALNEGE